MDYWIITANEAYIFSHEEIRKKIIHILTNRAVLIIFDPQFPAELNTDASALGYGGIQLHMIENKPHVVEYYGKTTKLWGCWCLRWLSECE